MKKYFIVLIFVLITLSLFSNEKRNNPEKKRSSSFSFQFNTNNQDGFETSYLQKTGNNFLPIDKFSTSPSKYRRHLIAGITMMSVGGFLFFILSPIFIGCGVYLITFVVQKTAYSGTTAQRYYYETPYQDAGIVLTVFGGIFFLSAIGLIIAGAINLALAYRDKKESANLSRNKNNLAFISSFDMKSRTSQFGIRYCF